MKLSKLNIARWILVFLSPVLFLFASYFMETADEDSVTAVMIIVSLWMSVSIAVLVLFINKRSTISDGLKKTLLVLIPISSLFYLLFNYVFEFQTVSAKVILTEICSYTFFYTVVLCFISYLEKIEIMLLGLIFVTVAAFITNRLGVAEGEVMISFAFLLSSVGFIHLIFKSISGYKANKLTGRLFTFFYTVIGILNTLFLLKFLGSNPYFNNFFDTTGVIIFLLACLSLFIILPFSNYIDWPGAQKLSFKRLIVIPLIFFLLIFSFKFLLPENTYRSIFSKEYSLEEKIYFGMKDYKIDFSGQ